MALSLDYFGDGLGTTGKNLSFFNQEPFREASRIATEGSAGVYGPGTIDVRWRQHIACFAAQHGLHLEGDFVECGVNTGLLSMSICHFLDIDKTDKKIYLFDTYEGIPLEQLEESEKKLAAHHNKKYYNNNFDRAKENFKEFNNAVIVKGLLPDSLNLVDIDRICFLSIDLNQAFAEKSVIEILWDKLSPGAIVVIDDYGWRGHERQYDMWNDFASNHDRYIATLPTGQGLLMK